MINLHRYLTKLTDHQLCFMSDKDLENFDWNHPNSDDDDDICYEFEVKKNQEREDFKIYPGFEVNLSDKIKTEINNNIQDDIPLYPIVVGSATNQSPFEDFMGPESSEHENIISDEEEKYQDGSMRLNVRNISASESMFSNGYRFHHEIETTQPDQLQITIYETSLEQADTLQLQEDELHVPNPTLPSHYSCGQYGTSFHLDPQVYDFRKISQFDNHKFLLVLWNKKASKAEIFFDTAQKLAQNFKQSYSNRSYRILNTDENYFIAVNEPKELIAIFDTRRAVLVKLSIYRQLFNP
ncbi:unnamed protein product [Rhizophagus irregularis]|uniref:Uncharacterized protein n=1 Tax=Rhizophagus irregularis TaxID=588596 RepID=A0A915YY08_9GLOM|nr:unnamed protein product [Rhizophagus irregularis]